MKNKPIIGIDPDSTNIVCCLIESNNQTIQLKTFFTAEKGLQQFIKWVKNHNNILIAIEGAGGQSTPLENKLKENLLPYFSILAYRIAKYRKAVLGENKNNCTDAETVARFACTMDQQGQLDAFKNEYETDIELQQLTRDFEYVTKAYTRELNILWKYLKYLSNDLYLTLQGKNPDSTISYNILKKKGILQLLSAKPDISEWQFMGFDEFINTMGGRNYRGRKKWYEQLQILSKNSSNSSASLRLSIQLCAQRLLQLYKHRIILIKELEAMSKTKKETKHLLKIRGIGIISATTIIAEIRDIDRFKNNNKLASYSGIGLVENKTGDNQNMKSRIIYNHRLKDAFMQGALAYIRYNPDSHLTAYHKFLLKKGMKKLRAQRRVARAFIRKIFRELKNFKEEEIKNVIKPKKASDMAIGYTPIESNIPPATSTYII